MQASHVLSPSELEKTVEAICKVYEKAPDEVSSEPRRAIETPCLKLFAYLRFSVSIPTNAILDISRRFSEQWHNIAIADRFDLARYCLNVVIFQRSFSEIVLEPSRDEINNSVIMKENPSMGEFYRYYSFFRSEDELMDTIEEKAFKGPSDIIADYLGGPSEWSV